MLGAGWERVILGMFALECAREVEVEVDVDVEIVVACVSKFPRISETGFSI